MFLKSTRRLLLLLQTKTLVTISQKKSLSCTGFLKLLDQFFNIAGLIYPIFAIGSVKLGYESVF